ncbi:MAG: hypothetical protein AB8B80_09135 [Marinicellaceae bacterium]
MKIYKIIKNKAQLFVVLLMAIVNLTQAQTPVGTGFSYQGELLDNGVPANGNYDIRVEPFFDETGGTGVIFSTNTILNVPVTNGLFNVVIDFGDIIYGSSNTVWMEISMRKTSDGGNYTMLSPRQRIKAVPYAVQSEYANQANIANTAQTSDSASDLLINGSSTGDVLAYNGINWSWSKSISVNGNNGASIGTDLVPPSNGLRVAGDLSQDVNSIGLPKYMVSVACLNVGNSISFNDLTGGNGTLTVESTNTDGYCFINFPVSLTGRYYLVSALSNDGANTSCAINNNNSNQLQCQFVTRNGAYSIGSFMIMVY